MSIHRPPTTTARDCSFQTLRQTWHPAVFRPLGGAAVNHSEPLAHMATWP